MLLTVGTGLAIAAGADGPVAGWQERLGRIERDLRGLKPGDAAGAATVARDLVSLRADLTAFLATFPPATQDPQPWLAAAAPAPAAIPALADEVSRLRGVVSRIAAALDSGGTGGAFYLGRLDVAVTADAAVTATADLAPAGAVTLASKDIAAHDRVALSGALSMAPGVSFARVGQRNETTVYVRGFDVRQVPVFMDGIPIYTPYDGYADLSRFTTFDMAELQVSKGFTSVIYGANTLGGAINIISRRPASRVEGLAGAFAGTGVERSAFANLGTRAERWYLQGGGSYLHAGYMPMSAAFVPVRYEDGDRRENSYRTDSKVNVKAGFTPAGRGEYAISYVGQRAEKGNPPYAGTDTAVKVRYWQWPYWDRDSVYVVSNTPLGKAGYLRGRVFHDAYKNMLYAFDDATYSSQTKPSSFKSPYDDRTTGGSAEWGVPVAGRHTLRAVAHVKQDDHQEHNIGEPIREQQGWITSYGVEDSITLKPTLSMVAGLGYDRQTTTTAQGIESGAVVDLPKGTTSGWNPQAGVFWAVPQGMLRLTVSRKTRLPSMKDRYSYKFGTAIPNPLLEAEHATTVETGFQGAAGSRTTLQASVFYSRIENLIQRYMISANLSQQRNVGRASSAGFEADVRSRLGGRIDLAGNYTYLHRANLSAPDVPLTETPAHKGMVSVTAGPYHRVRVMASVDAEAGRETLNEGAHYFDVPAFAVLSLKVSWNVYRRVDLDLGVQNATDRNIWVVDGYPESGRVVRASVNWRF